MVYNKIVLTFCDPITKNNEFDIEFSLCENTTAKKWVNQLYDDINIKKCTWSNNRYVGFNKDISVKYEMANEINDILSICELERPGYFNMSANENMNQDDLNYLHLYVEKFRGNMDDPHIFFKEGTQKFKDSIERLNQVIHAWEAINLDREPYVEFDFYGDSGVLELDDSDFSNFNLENCDNTIYLSYSMRGKCLRSLWRDNDLHIGNHNIQPYKYIKSNFFITTNGWSKEQTDINKNDFNYWFEKNSNFLNSLGFYRDDPKCTIGWLPLAHSTLLEIKSIIEPRQYLKKIEIF